MLSLKSASRRIQNLQEHNSDSAEPLKVSQPRGSAFRFETLKQRTDERQTFEAFEPAFNPYFLFFSLGSVFAVLECKVIPQQLKAWE